ncbi:MAG: hypothetical protein ACRYGG_18225 [Janthinobacterium lividum]
MSTTTKTVSTLEVREGSKIHTTYSMVSDGKLHKLKQVIAKLEKGGDDKPQLSVLRLGLLLRAKTNMKLVIDREAGTIQMISSGKSKKSSKAAAPAEVEAPTRSAKRKAVAAVKAAVVDNVDNDDDVMEE